MQPRIFAVLGLFDGHPVEKQYTHRSWYAHLSPEVRKDAVALLDEGDSGRAGSGRAVSGRADEGTELEPAPISAEEG